MYEQARGTSYLSGANAPFIEALYERYLQDPAAVDARWRAYFDSLQSAGTAPDVSHAAVQARFSTLARERTGARTSPPAAPSAPSRVALPAAPVQPAGAQQPQLTTKQYGILQLIGAYRAQGVRHADVDPLKRREKPVIDELDPAYYGLSEADMDTVFGTGSLFAPREMKLRDILQLLRETYCRTLGVEYMYMTDIPQRRWVQERLEPVRAAPRYDAEYKKHILERLTAAETLERYLHARYVGQTRFSLEGSDALIPMLDNLLQHAGAAGVQEAVIGMAHRGRLNVLVNTLGKQPAELFSEFEGKYGNKLVAGDVKYHDGFSSDVSTPGGPLHLSLAFNPSHLEIVDPVVEGAVRARQHRRGDKLGNEVLPVLIHGDASFAGQGVVMETLNLAQTRGFSTGGTVHIIINNQIGFTTSDPRDSRSTLYCSDVAKMLEVPIFHVNGDDPEAVCMATEIALEYRMQFHKDVVIDLVCYRRLGHNEQDEPMVTQPLMYKKIRELPTTRELYARRLTAEGVIDAAQADAMIAAYRAALDAGRHTNKTILYDYKALYAVDWKRFKSANKWNENDDTRLPPETLTRLAQRVTEVPAGFQLHPRVEKIMADRRKMAAGELYLDWGMAETLAYASLLAEGYSVRLSGQDVSRGTFFHRHAMLHDQNRESWDQGMYVPLQHVSETQGDFVSVDSVLSEEAVLAYEYGYATSAPDDLVVWEAQYGDFANGAQVVIDQFVASGEVKWGRMCGLVMLLPHGYEGAGPEHSSGRIERFMQLCADYNMQVCVPATPVQMYYLLRRQMIRPYRRPLIVFTPKSILRLKESASPFDAFSGGTFKAVNEEWDDAIDPAAVKRIVFCSGKVFYDLRAARRARGIADIPLLRIAQLYPFPHDDFRAEIEKYRAASEVVWCQEEPRNQGAWRGIQHYLQRHLLPHQTLIYAGRDSSATPAAGHKALHESEQKALVEFALTPGAASSADGVV